ALDTQSNEKVIIKTPSVNFEDDPQYIDGFLQEEWAGRRINNLHVLKVIEPKRRRRFLYYVTEHIEGQTLEQWISDHPKADIKIVRPLVKQLVAGIRAFRRQEMIHQDLKPGNIMIDHQGTVKIIDFGSTKIAGIQEVSSPIQRGELLGTYDYAAPEYFEGYPGTHQSDIYSLGVIVYEMLTGALPYGGPLSQRKLKKAKYVSARQHNSEIPPWIDGALEKATHINPKQRYDLMSEFVVDLSKPNPTLIKSSQPLLEKNPLGFWRFIAIASLLLNLVLLHFVATG
ncbi:MAG TPA: serine/threonine protein kinase, partial [Candidatus Tenderia sp.]|nr:serine/threonine protein kinase [Candidatus Tenderia sp.]